MSAFLYIIDTTCDHGVVLADSYTEARDKVWQYFVQDPGYNIIHRLQPSDIEIRCLLMEDDIIPLPHYE